MIMEKIKTFIKKYKAEILIALGAVSTIATFVATIDGINVTAVSIVISIVAVAIELFKNGLTNTALTLLSSAIKIIIEEINKKQNTGVVTASETYLTVEDIKDKLKEGLK